MFWGNLVEGNQTAPKPFFRDVNLDETRKPTPGFVERVIKVTPPTRDFDTGTDRGTAAVGLPKATHGPG